MPAQDQEPDRRQVKDFEGYLAEAGRACLFAPETDYDADALVLYDDTVPAADVLAAAQALADAGKTVCVRRQIPAKLRYRELVSLTKGGADRG